MIHHRVTDAQASALQCRDWSEEPNVSAAWDGRGTLAFFPEDAGALADELTEASNAEDAQAENRHEDIAVRRGARGASIALHNLSVCVARYADPPPEPDATPAPGADARGGRHGNAPGAD